MFVARGWQDGYPLPQAHAGFAARRDCANMRAAGVKLFWLAFVHFSARAGKPR